MMQRFLNRREAGKRLAQKLLKYDGRKDVILLALPRGGVPVAYEVAQILKAALDVLIVRKLGLPGEEELAIGAIASGGVRILNQDIIGSLSVGPEVIDRITEREKVELQRREQQYRGDRPSLEVRDRAVILVDDGLATGASMLAAAHAVRVQQPARIIVAVPAASMQAVDILRREVEEVVYGMTPEPFEGVGRWYEDFSQTTDQEVQFLLEQANQNLQNK